MRPAPGMLDYLVNGIAATPVVFTGLLGGLDRLDPRWDARPDPSRFTLREMIAHVADWDDVFLRRFERILEEDGPLLESIDEAVLCSERGYSGQDPVANLERHRTGRGRLVQALRDFPADAWGRTAHREFIGDVDAVHLASIVLGHDMYHLRQSAEFLQRV
ncbi:MAG: DinB family protein [Armatimonadetes bacterium]|nr:DinB family protein [Armatimonadota bacterium]